MADDAVVAFYSNSAIADTKKSPHAVKVSRAQLLRGGAIIDVTNAHQAKIAEEAGACAVIVSEADAAARRPGVARMPDPSLIKEIKSAVSIPVMAKARVGHFVEAQILEAVGADYIDESELLTPADHHHHINKHNFRVPFVCGSCNLGEASRRIREGAALIRTVGDASGAGDVAAAVKCVRSVMGEIRALTNMDDDEVFAFSKRISAPYDLVAQIKQLGRLPVLHFAAGGVTTPADAAMMMQLGCDGVFVGCEIFESGDPYGRARAIVRAVSHYNDPQVLAEVSCGVRDGVAGLRLTGDMIEQFAASGN